MSIIYTLYIDNYKKYLKISPAPSIKYAIARMTNNLNKKSDISINLFYPLQNNNGRYWFECSQQFNIEFSLFDPGIYGGYISAEDPLGVEDMPELFDPGINGGYVSAEDPLGIGDRP